MVRFGLVVSGKCALMASGKPLEAVHDGDEDVFDAPGCRQVVITESQTLRPSFVGQSQAENLAFASR